MKIPEWTANSTVGELYTPAMEVSTHSEAHEYLEALITHAMKTWNQSREVAEQIQKQNLGYYAGYYDSRTAKKVMELFDCEHPIFGKSQVTPEEAFEMGLKFGTESKERDEFCKINNFILDINDGK